MDISTKSDSPPNHHKCMRPGNCISDACFAQKWPDDRIVAVLSSLLEKNANTNTEIAREIPHNSTLNAFAFKSLLPIKEVVEQAVSTLRISRSLFITAYAYMKMAEAKHDELKISYLTVRHLLATSIMLAAKGYDESYERNTEFAAACGIFSTAGINKCEEVLFNILGQNLFLSKEKFEEFEEIWENESEQVYDPNQSKEKYIGGRKRKQREGESREEDQSMNSASGIDEIVAKRLKF